MENTWGTTRTGMVYHSFNPDGSAICRKNITRPEGVDTLTEEQVDGRLAEAWGARVRGFRKCESCTQLEAASRDRAEDSMEPSAGEGDYLPPAQDATPAPDVWDAPQVGTPVTVTYPGRPPFTGTVAHLHTAPGFVAVKGDRWGIVQNHSVSLVTLSSAPEEKEDDMSSPRSRPTTGPLTQRQMDILDHISKGMTHEATAKELGVSRVWVSESVRMAVAKMGVTSSWEAVARWVRRQALLDAADMVERVRVAHPVDDVERHVNRVLDGRIETLRDRAARLIPS